MSQTILVIFLISMVAGIVYSQPQVGAITPEMRATANEAYQKQDWKTAATGYEKIVKAEDKNVGARYRYGVALTNMARNADAKREFENVFAASPNAIFALALARVHARLGDTKGAMEVLEKSIALGGIAPETLSAEKDFAPMKNDARFADILKRSDITVNPCKASPEFRQFDFWIGGWEAKNPQGLVAGTSSIQLILGTCTIFENWTGTSGTNGKSFNIYDTTDKKWHQTWVDDKGTFTHYIGGIEDGKMVITADTVISAKKTLAKMTFSKQPNGDVRQHGENSTDDGKTWATTFDLMYARKK